jgi:urease accessory protein
VISSEETEMLNPKSKWLALLLLTSFQAQAHTDQLPQMSFQIGLLHPLTGFDHLLAMLLIGMTAALTPKIKLSLPLVFSFGLLIGTLATGWLNAAINIELWVAISVVALVWRSTRINPTLQMGVVGIFAIAHGAAHNISLPSTPDLASTAGLLIISLLLQSIGFAIGQHPCFSKKLALDTKMTS